MGGHHEETYKVPSHTTYKIDGIKRLEAVRDTLAKDGLRDPWIRNEVYRYQFHEVSAYQRLYRCLGGRYMPIGIGIGVAAALAHLAWDASHPTHHGDDHGGHH